MKAKTDPSKSQVAYDRLRGLIESGRLDHGQRLTEGKAMELTGLNRGPVRESILRLESEGLLHNRGHRRSRVVVTYTEDEDPEEMLHRYQLREQIESGASRLAAKNMNGWQIDCLRDMAMRAEEARGAGDRDGQYRGTHECLQYLLENCGNPLFLDVWNSKGLVPPRPRDPALEERIQADMRDAGEQQSLLDVVDAIEAHDPDRAERCVKQQVRWITDELWSLLQGRDAVKEASGEPLGRQPQQKERHSRNVEITRP